MVAINNKTVNVNVHHLTRVEGHGNIIVDLYNGVLQRCELEIIEAPRYFEAMLRGQPYHNAHTLAARICGICAVSHSTASLTAVENALQVNLSEQTMLLRKLNMLGEMLDSHILHTYMLVAPDVFEVGSVIPLLASAPEIVNRALRMKKVAGDLCALIGGRHTHPIALTVGGFTHFPDLSGLELIYAQLQSIRSDVEETIALFRSVDFPEFERETEYIALTLPDEYAFIGGSIASTDGGLWTMDEYQQVTNEYLVAHSTAKFARHQRESYMVGALARFNLNYKHLHPLAKSAATALNLAPICTNPYLISLAQLVEVVHCYATSLGLLELLLNQGVSSEAPAVPNRLSGEGVGAVEAPRGTLYHHYKIWSSALTDANCVIPTAQNLGNIEADMRRLVPQLQHLSKDEITRSLEMLVRAYDPCISCSTHMLEVKFT